MAVVLPEGCGYVPPDELRLIVHRVVSEAASRPQHEARLQEARGPLQGAAVEYWSDTFHRWVAAFVRAVNDDGTLDLDVKRGANPTKVRPKSSDGPAEGPPLLSGHTRGGPLPAVRGDEPA